jgi:hypothetical protein
MPTSFRLPDEHIKRLTYLAERLGTSRAQVVKEAINMLYEEHIRKSGRTALDRLLDSGFEPLDIDLNNITTDKNRQRQVIRERLSKKNRS